LVNDFYKWLAKNKADITDEHFQDAINYLYREQDASKMIEFLQNHNEQLTLF
jgi:hypothetical protein